MKKGDIRLLYYGVVIALALIVNGSALVAVLAAALAWWFEPSFEAWLNERVQFVTPKAAKTSSKAKATKKPSKAKAASA